jgi:hypothetical protein
MRWVGHVARKGNKTNACWVLVVKSDRKDKLEYLGVDERIILNVVLKQ